MKKLKQFWLSFIDYPDAFEHQSEIHYTEEDAINWTKNWKEDPSYKTDIVPVVAYSDYEALLKRYEKVKELNDWAWDYIRKHDDCPKDEE